MIFISGGEERREKNGRYVVLVEHVFRGTADTGGYGDIWTRDVETSVKGDWDSCGYRTAMSQKNQETWDFAQHACGRLWWKGGWMLLVISVGAQLPFRGCDAGTVGKAVLVLCVFQCVCMVGTVVLVELVLRRNFYDDGRRKEGNAADLQKSEPF